MAQDEQYIELVCAQVYEPLVRAMTMYAADRSTAEDATHEALVRLLIRLRDGDCIDNPGGWAYRVAVNHINGQARRRKIRDRLPLAGPAPRVEQTSDDRIDLNRALQKLPQRQRAAIVARFELGLSVRDTATVLKCREGTVRALTHQAAAALRVDSTLRPTGA